MISRSIVFACVALLSACAAPPLTLYTLETSGAASNVPLARDPVVIAIARVTLPDELDTEDIVVRNGSTLTRSQRGRWASRLSLGITDRLARRLAAQRPAALVTAQPLLETPTYRILINIQRLDITTAGVATLDADWIVVPRDAAAPTRRERAHFSVTGPVGTDQDVVTLVGNLLDRLANAIDLPKSGHFAPAEKGRVTSHRHAGRTR